MKNGERDENSPVEIIEGRLKRLHSNAIDARKQTRALVRRGWEGGKTKATWKGKPTNILKRKTLVENKDFARVGRILDYGLRFRG